jgi:uncharacterized protein DUF1559
MGNMADLSGSTENETVDMPAKSSSGRILKVVIFVFMLCAGFIALGFLLIPRLRESARRMECKSKMNQLGEALGHFHSAQGHFPGYDDPAHPEYPPCSWRVQVLTYYTSDPYYDRYDRMQPWDSEANISLEKRVSHLSICPSNPGRMDGNITDTDFVSIVGPKCVFRDKGSTTIDDISDGVSNTIMLVESSNTGIHWMEPRDLKFEDTRIVDDDSTDRGIRSHHVDVVNVTLCDGSVKSISKDIDPKLLKALITIDGGESVESFHEGY